MNLPQQPDGSVPAATSRERTVFYGLLMGLLNLLPRILAAMLSDSVTLYTDALRSATETLANFCSWIAVRKIERGRQTGFEYGLGKLENLTSVLIVGAMVITVAVMGANSVFRLFHPVAVHRLWLGLLVSFLAGVVNWVLWHKSRRLAQTEPSPLMESQWRLMRNKFLANVCVLCTLVLNTVFSGHPLALYIDPVASLLLCAFICFSLYGMLAGSVSALLDKTLEENLQLAILKRLVAFEAHYEQLFAIRSRRSGHDVFIDVFMEFDGQKKMAEVQAHMDEMQHALERDIPGSQVVIVPARRPPARGCPPGA